MCVSYREQSRTAASASSDTTHEILALRSLSDAQRLGRAWGMTRVGGQTLDFGAEDEPVRLTAAAWGDGIALWWFDSANTPTRTRLRQWLRRAESSSGLRAVLCGRGRGETTLVASFVPGTREMVAQAVASSGASELAALEAAGAESGGMAEPLLLELEELLGRRPLGRAFVSDFRKAWQSLAEAWTGVPADAAEDRKELALITLSRLLFLAFVQARGWLDGRSHFLQEEVSADMARTERFSSAYQRVLCPLFFGVLNTPPEERDSTALAFGRIPYLNGGLFGEDPLERDYPERDVADDVLWSILDGVFRDYVFCGSEAELESRFSPSEGQRGVIDPAMLGHVFESLMASDERGRSGSFYTPGHIVARIVREALVAHCAEALERRARQSHVPSLRNGRLREALHQVFEHGDVEQLSVEEAEALDRILHRVRILDPAAGSGAFIVGAFDQIVATRLDLAAYAALPWDAAYLRRHTATHNLYGVDLLPAAIRLCELRLWLALSWGQKSNDISEIPPLPNLDLALRQGNSLLEVRDVDSVLTVSRGTLDPELLRGLSLKKEQYLSASGSEKARLRRKIETEERSVFGELLSDGIERLQKRIDSLGRLEEAPNLFGEARGLNPQEEVLRRELQRRMAELDQFRMAVERDGQPFFAFGLHFAEVVEEGGFDIVVGNPPWVRPHRQSKELKRRIRTRYRSSHRASWATGASLGGSIKAAQVDLSAIFVERGLQLVRPGGVVSMLVPSKLFNALGAGGMRRVVEQHAQVESIVDWSQSSEQLFGATTYPAMLLMRRKGGIGASSVHIEQRLPRGRIASCRTAPSLLSLVPGDAASPWLLVDPVARQRLEQMQSTSVSLGTRFEMRRGVVTGCNRVFIAESVIGSPGDETMTVRFKGDREAELESRMLYPVLRGSDVAAWKATPSRTMLFTHDRDGDALGALPPRTAHYLESRQEALVKRVDLRNGMVPWSIFRVHDGALGPRVVWRDIAGRLEASFVPGSINAPLVGERPVVPLNTVYYAPVESEEEGFLLAALLNSSPAREFTGAIAEHARGDYRRFFSWVVGLVPWPFTDASPDLLKQLVAASKELHGALGPIDAERRAELLNQVDVLCARSYGLDDVRH